MSNSHKYNLPVSRPWVEHLLFWFSYYIFGALISLSIHQIYDTRFYWELLSLLPPDMFLVYINLYVLAPAFLLKRRFVLYGLSIILLIFLVASVNIFMHGVYARAGSAVFATTSEFIFRNYAGQFLNSIYLLGLATAIKFTKDWMLQRQQLQEKERQQVATELNFLKSQIHPHFFFNTLNNLYSLTLQKSDLAPEVVLKLSDLMSYMLYESGAPLVDLEKEISNLENYLALEKLRFGGRLSLSFEKKGLPAAAIRIPPLLLLAFVENSFKHGMNQLIGEGCIRIVLEVSTDQLLFSIDNSIQPSRSPGEENAAGMKNGLGLKNVIRRLDLLYGSRYHLDMAETKDNFHVTLKIPLS